MTTENINNRLEHSRVLNGVLHLHSETGTEGGYWAFQDERFIKPSFVERCNPCGNFGYVPIEEAAGFGGARDYRQDLEIQQRWIRQWEEDRASREAEIARSIQQLGFALERPAPCAPGTHNWELFTPDGSWSYDGLHLLQDGDHLTIFSKEREKKARSVVWEGVVDLLQFGLFTESASGLWIHADQKGISRETWSEWFFKHFPARLTKAGR